MITLSYPVLWGLLSALVLTYAVVNTLGDEIPRWGGRVAVAGVVFFQVLGFLIVYGALSLLGL